MEEIYYATSNPVKFQEAKLFFSTYAPHILLIQYDAEIDEIQTLDQKVIALQKALAAWQVLKKPVLAEDAGIYFEKYNHFPGTLTKYVYKGIGFEGILRLINENDAARFQISLAFVYAQDQYIIFQASCAGRVLPTKNYAHANPSVPFDLIFVPDGQEKTFEELRRSGDLEKYNYRAHALKQFITWHFSSFGNELKSLDFGEKSC